MIKNIDVKTHCYLLMINKQFLEMFDTNEMWKRQFVKTTRLKILDTSIHIGPCGGYDVNKVPLSYWKCDTTIHQKGDTSYKCCCGKGFQHQIVSIFPQVLFAECEARVLEQYHHTCAFNSRQNGMKNNN